MKQLIVLVLALSLTACGYGWKDENSANYPPSGNSRGAVVQGQVPARSAGPDEYVVQPGDTLYAIGFRNQIDYHDLARWNDIGGDYLIRPGQILRLSASADSGDMVARPLSQPAPIIAQPKPIAVPGPVSPPVVATVPVLSVPPVPRAMPQGNAAQRWQWPTSGEVIKTYNMAQGSKGIDIAGVLGQAVQAVAGGKVVYSGSALKGYGELIIVKHDDTYLSAYGHNRRRLVKEGDEVRAGQTIAELGLGPEQKPLLHFEIRENGKPVEPLAFLPRR